MRLAYSNKFLPPKRPVLNINGLVPPYGFDHHHQHSLFGILHHHTSVVSIIHPPIREYKLLQLRIAAQGPNASRELFCARHSAFAQLYLPVSMCCCSILSTSTTAAVRCTPHIFYVCLKSYCTEVLAAIPGSAPRASNLKDISKSTPSWHPWR